MLYPRPALIHATLCRTSPGPRGTGKASRVPDPGMARLFRFRGVGATTHSHEAARGGARPRPCAAGSLPPPARRAWSRCAAPRAHRCLDPTWGISAPRRGGILRAGAAFGSLACVSSLPCERGHGSCRGNRTREREAQKMLGNLTPSNGGSLARYCRAPARATDPSLTNLYRCHEWDHPGTFACTSEYHDRPARRCASHRRWNGARPRGTPRTLLHTCEPPNPRCNSP